MSEGSVFSVSLAHFFLGTKTASQFLVFTFPAFTSSFAHEWFLALVVGLLVGFSVGVSVGRSREISPPSNETGFESGFRVRPPRLPPDKHIRKWSCAVSIAFVGLVVAVPFQAQHISHEIKSQRSILDFSNGASFCPKPSMLASDLLTHSDSFVETSLRVLERGGEVNGTIVHGDARKAGPRGFPKAARLGSNSGVNCQKGEWLALRPEVSSTLDDDNYDEKTQDGYKRKGIGGQESDALGYATDFEGDVPHIRTRHDLLRASENPKVLLPSVESPPERSVSGIVDEKWPFGISNGRKGFNSRDGISEAHSAAGSQWIVGSHRSPPLALASHAGANARTLHLVSIWSSRGEVEESLPFGQQSILLTLSAGQEAVVVWCARLTTCHASHLIVASSRFQSCIIRDRKWSLHVRPHHKFHCAETISKTASLPAMYSPKPRWCFEGEEAIQATPRWCFEGVAFKHAVWLVGYENKAWKRKTTALDLRSSDARFDNICHWLLSGFAIVSSLDNEGATGSH